MANPSTSPASAAGTEILRRVYYDSLSGATNRRLIEGQANYTYTILNIIFTEMGDAAELLNLWIDAEGSGTTITLLSKQPVGARGTFVFDQKILMAHEDDLWVGVHDAATIDVYCTYIEQRWA